MGGEFTHYHWCTAKKAVNLITKGTTSKVFGDESAMSIRHESPPNSVQKYHRHIELERVNES